MGKPPLLAVRFVVTNLAAALTVGVLPLPLVVPAAQAAGGTTTLVSSALDGTPGNGSSSSYALTIAGDGSAIAFTSSATNLLAPALDANGVSDVFVKVVSSGAVELISVANGGGPADGRSSLSDMSPDGRWVAFTSLATNLTAVSLSSCCERAYLRDRIGGTTVLLDGAGSALLSDEAEFVFFDSGRDDLVAGQLQDGQSDLFRLVRATGSIALVSVGADGFEADASMELRFISSNGRFAGVWSAEDDLVPNDTNSTPDVFLRDIDAARTERISVTTGGGQTHDICTCISYGAAGGISEDGNLVLFDSRADDIVVGDTNQERDVFLRNRIANTTIQVNVKPDGTQSNREGYYSRLTRDGLHAVYASYATDLAPGTVAPRNAVLADLTVSPPVAEIISQGGGGPNGGVLPGVGVDVSDDGRYVTFASSTGGVGPANSYQVYLRDRLPPGDTVPPAVIGVPDRAANRAGWYRAPVTIDWQATDPPASSGTPTDPADTLAATDGFEHAYVSGASCDPANNCATGSLRLSIDRTAPSATGASASTAAIPLGGAARIDLSATDGLSGIAGGEWFVGADPGEGSGAPGDVTAGGVAFVVGSDLPTGSRTISVRAFDAAGNWSAVRTVSLRVTAVESSTACNFEQDATESNDTIRLSAEQGRSTALLCRALPLDIATPGQYGPASTGAGFNASAALAPGTVPTGSSVRSFLVHADRAYTVTQNGDFLVRQVRLDFNGGTILGLAVRDGTLNTTDVLGAPGTLLPTNLVYRGHEINVPSGRTFLNPKDWAILSSDRTSVTLNLQVGEAVDQVRVVTTAGAQLAPTSTGFRTVTPPPSVRLDEFNTEICQGKGTPPKSCTGKQNELDDIVVLFEQTVQDVVLRNPLAVNIALPGAHTVLPAPAPAAIPAGTALRSHLLHVDRPGPSSGFSAGDFQYSYGSVTFDRPILGIITSDSGLDTSDLMGASGTYYPTGLASRGADFGGGPGLASDERIVLSDDRLTVTVRFQTGNGLDQIRVITAGGAALTNRFVVAVGTQLAINGIPWTLHGASTYHTTNRGGPNDPDQLLALAAAGNLNTLRIGEMFDQINGLRAAPYDESDWARIDAFLEKMRQAGMRAILDLSAFRNHLVHRDIALGGWTSLCRDDIGVTVPERLTVDFAGISPYRATAYAEWDRFLAFVANRVNSVNGIPYRHDPTIAIVSFAGEPEPPGSLRCGKALDTAQLTAFYAHVMPAWKAHDPRHLLSNGGFIHLDWEELHGNAAGSGIDWRAIFALPENDIPSIHTYPARIDAGIPADFQSPKIGPFVASLGKPWFTEEFGWNQGVGDATRAGWFQWLYDRQATYGSAGAAFWNLGFEFAAGTFDVGTATPATWTTVQVNAP